MYLRESPTWKSEFGALVLVESIKTFFDGFNRGMSNFCETVSLINSSSSSGVKPIGLPVLGSSFVHMEAKVNLNLEYLEIDTTFLQNSENLINPAWISNSRTSYHNKIIQ